MSEFEDRNGNVIPNHRGAYRMDGMTASQWRKHDKLESEGYFNTSLCISCGERFKSDDMPACEGCGELVCNDCVQVNNEGECFCIDCWEIENSE